MKKVSKLKALDKFDITQKVIFPSTEKLKELRNNIVKYMEQEYFLTLCRLITENIVDSINSYKQ